MAPAPWQILFPDPDLLSLPGVSLQLGARPPRLGGLSYTSPSWTGPSCTPKSLLHAYRPVHSCLETPAGRSHRAVRLVVGCGFWVRNMAPQHAHECFDERDGYGGVLEVSMRRWDGTAWILGNIPQSRCNGHVTVM